MPTTEALLDQVTEFEGKALSFVKERQAPVVEQVARFATTLADRLPSDRPAALQQGIDAVVGQVDFVKSLIDTRADFVKAVLDAVVSPVKPTAKVATVARARTVKAA